MFDIRKWFFFRCSSFLLLLLRLLLPLPLLRSSSANQPQQHPTSNRTNDKKSKQQPDRPDIRTNKPTSRRTKEPRSSNEQKFDNEKRTHNCHKLSPPVRTVTLQDWVGEFKFPAQIADYSYCRTKFQFCLHSAMTCWFWEYGLQYIPVYRYALDGLYVIQEAIYK